MGMDAASPTNLVELRERRHARVEHEDPTRAGAHGRAHCPGPLRCAPVDDVDAAARVLRSVQRLGQARERRRNQRRSGILAGEHAQGPGTFCARHSCTSASCVIDTGAGTASAIRSA